MAVLNFYDETAIHRYRRSMNFSSFFYCKIKNLTTNVASFFFYQTFSIAHDAVKERVSIKLNLNLFNVVIFRCIPRTLLIRATIARYDRDDIIWPENRRIVNILLSTAICVQRLFRIFNSILWQLLLFILSPFPSLRLFEDILSTHHTTRLYLAFERKSFLFAYIENIATTLKQPSVSLISIR